MTEVTNPQIAGTGQTPAQLPANGGGEETKAYTQAELDRMFGERAKQARSSVTKDLLAKLGVKSLDEFKAALVEMKTQKAKSMNEADKIKAKALQLQKERDELSEQLRGDRMMRLVERAATALNFQDPEDAYLRLRESLVLSDDGNTIEGLEDALKKLAAAKPYMIKSSAPAAAPNINSTASSGQVTPPLEDIKERKRRQYSKL